MARSVSLFAERAVARGHAASPAPTRGMSAESSSRGMHAIEYDRQTRGQRGVCTVRCWPAVNGSG